MTASRARFVAAGCVVAIAVANAPIAHADNVAEALFNDGKALMDAGKYGEACPKLAASHKREPGGGVVLAYAICLDKQGKIASAWVRYREAVAYAKKANRQDRLDIAEPRIAALGPRVPYLSVKLSAGAVGASVTLDGEALEEAALGTPLPIDPGPHVLVATNPNRAPFRREIVAEEAKTVEVVVDFAPVSAAKETPTDFRGPIGIGVLTFGGIALGVGAFFGVSALRKKQTEELACRGVPCTGKSLDDARAAYEDARVAARWSTIGFAVGVVGTGIGIFLLVGGNGGKKDSATALRVAPLAMQGGGGLTLGGTF